ncbi:SRPBCC family protein [Mycolicibacterium arenosum]|uniref:SRPBCC family protein n=1 Tax=Mycolicibacterium arenosum TaxID=2952157 RepID=A0ABT1LXF1_9MYCO|nr:SRPBCC family protein [Mycolicibacterium sp. CAU 1645]MCP9271561.1 SRPBCC family protein [Mycolicibacterium sp. CAU 1645]
MQLTPTGRLLDTPQGRDLELTRDIQAPIEEVWASLTESERTARWFGSWTGAGRASATVRLTLTHEDGHPEADLTVIGCEPCSRLEVEAFDDHGRWHLEAWLTADAQGTTLRFVHHLDPEVKAASTGPGWEYYLDMLAASLTGNEVAGFDDYLSAMTLHYERLDTAS